MKKILTLTSIASIGAVLALLVACQTTGTSQTVVQKETLLAQSGFKVVTVKTRRTGSTLGNKPNSTHIRRQSRRSSRAGRLSNSNKCCTEEAPIWKERPRDPTTSKSRNSRGRGSLHSTAFESRWQPCRARRGAESSGSLRKGGRRLCDWTTRLG